MNPTKEFRDYMISQGAALVGIGDLTAVPSSDYPVGIAVAIPLPKHVIKDLQLAPTREYYKLYTTLNDKLNAIVTAGLCPDNRPDNSRLGQPQSFTSQNCCHQSRPRLDRQKLSACNTTIWLCCKDFFSSDRCPAYQSLFNFSISIPIRILSHSIPSFSSRSKSSLIRAILGSNVFLWILSLAAVCATFRFIRRYQYKVL